MRHALTHRPRLRVTSLFKQPDYLETTIDRPAVIRMNSISPDGRRVESRLYVDHLHKVQLARAMQLQFLRPEECAG